MRRRLEWFGHVKRRHQTEDIGVVVEIRMEGGGGEKTPKVETERYCQKGHHGRSGRNGHRRGKKNRSARPVTPYRDGLVKGGGGEIGERILQSGC